MFFFVLFFLLAVAVVAVGVAIGAWAFASRFIRSDNHAVPLPDGFRAEPVSIPGGKHVIAAWWIDKGENTPAVLLVHPLHSDRRTAVDRAKLLSARGYSVLLIDLQGHGETPGDVVTFGHRESSDVRAALAWLRSRVPSRRVGVIGCSLGGASILLGPQPAGFDAVVLEAVYPRITGAIENRLRIYLGRFGTLLRPLLTSQLSLRLKLGPRDLRPIGSIASVGAPVLIVAGSHDEHTTLEESKDLFESAVAPKAMWVLNGAIHEDFLAVDPAGYETHVLGFLENHLRVAA